jgi:hypothetical protein
MRSTIFCNTTSCICVEVHWCFRGTHYLHLQGRRKVKKPARRRRHVKAAWITLRLWRSDKYVPPKRRWTSTGLHDLNNRCENLESNKDNELIIQNRIWAHHNSQSGMEFLKKTCESAGVLLRLQDHQRYRPGYYHHTINRTLSICPSACLCGLAPLGASDVLRQDACLSVHQHWLRMVRASTEMGTPHHNHSWAASFGFLKLHYLRTVACRRIIGFIVPNWNQNSAGQLTIVSTESGM